MSVPSQTTVTNTQQPQLKEHRVILALGFEGIRSVVEGTVASGQWWKARW